MKFLSLFKKKDKRVRRTNGQVARKIPVNYYGKTVSYIYR